MTRFSALFLSVLAAGCAGGAAPPPAGEPGATRPNPSPVPAGPRPDQSRVPPDGPDSADLDVDAEAVGVRRLGRWSQSGIATPERLVIRDEADFSALWSRLGTGDQEPPLDFGGELVVVAAAGEKPTGGHSISMGRAVLRDGELVVEVIQSAPSPDCMTTQALTQPVDVVALAAEGVEKWRFVEREEAGGCGP